MRGCAPGSCARSRSRGSSGRFRLPSTLRSQRPGSDRRLSRRIGGLRMSDLLAVRALSAGYGRSQVLFGVDLDVREGEIVGLLGRNGMGKTTLVRTIMGLLPPMSGCVDFL